MPSSSSEFTITLEKVSSSEPAMPLAEVHQELWRWIDDFVTATCGKDEIDPDLWEEYHDEYEQGDSAAGRTELIFFFSDAYSRSAEAIIARHWAYLTLIARAEEFQRSLSSHGWRIADLVNLRDALATWSANIVYVGPVWYRIGQLGAHQTLAELTRSGDLFFSYDPQEDPGPKLGELTSDERAAVEWVAMTQLCQCPMCVALGRQTETYLNPLEWIDHARGAWELLETDQRAFELEALVQRGNHDWRAEPAGPIELDILEEHLAKRGVHLPRAALRTILRSRPSVRAPRELPKPLARPPTLRPKVVAEKSALAPAHDPLLDPLFARVYETPWDDAPRAALAEALSERGDPRGELIRLQLLSAPTKSDSRRINQLLKLHARSWLPSLLVSKTVRWQRGFPASAQLRELAPLPLSLATLREIDLQNLERPENFQAPCFAGVESWLGVPIDPDAPPAETSPRPSRVRRLGLFVGIHRWHTPESIERNMGPFDALEELIVDGYVQFDDGFLEWCDGLAEWIGSRRPDVRLNIGGILRYERREDGWKLRQIATPFALAARFVGYQGYLPTPESNRWLERARTFDGRIAVDSGWRNELALALGRRGEDVEPFEDFEVQAPLILK